jgi:hypothetical protein
MESDEVTMAELDEEARLDAPRMFALYGVFQHRVSDEDDGGYVSWGVEFADPQRAVMWSTDGSTFISSSAEQLLTTHNQLGQAKLVWLTDWPDAPGSGEYELAGG